MVVPVINMNIVSSVSTVLVPLTFENIFAFLASVVFIYL